MEKLEDKFDESLQIEGDIVDSGPSQVIPLTADALPRDGSTPEVPPQMQNVRSHTADEIVRMLGKTPLFMTSLDDTAPEEENIDLEAIRALQYEGTAFENAQSFKEQGNEMVMVKKWWDAKEFYTKAIAVLSRKIGKTNAEGHPDGRKESEIEEACFINRALCNLELKNYRSTTLDCASALRLNRKNIKAYYRSSQALLALDRIAEAQDACRRGLLLDQSNTALQSLRAKIQARDATLKAAQDKRRQQAEVTQKRKITLAAAVRARNIRTRKTALPPDLEDASIHLDPDPLSMKNFIKAFPETDTVHQHLDYILPLPWDEQGEYHISTVELYMETIPGGLVKVGKNTTLQQIFGSGDVEVVDELVTINVIPKRRAGLWIEELKIRKGK